MPPTPPRVGHGCHSAPTPFRPADDHEIPTSCQLTQELGLIDAVVDALENLAPVSDVVRDRIIFALRSSAEVSGVIRTYSTAEATERIGAPSERWLVEQLRAGRFPGRKIGRHWRMTDQDVRDALDLCRNNSRSVHTHGAPVVGLTPRSRKRISAENEVESIFTPMPTADRRWR
jgi:hypothetical protein